MADLRMAGHTGEITPNGAVVEKAIADE